MAKTAKVDLYNHPGFAPVFGELHGEPLRIEGTLPVGLDGVYLRNGTNALFPRRRPHMFDGEAMLHIVEIRAGNARYSNSIVRTPRTAYVEKRGGNPYVGFGELVGGDRSITRRMKIQRWKTKLGLLRQFTRIESVAAGTSVLLHDRRLYCLQETGLPFVLDVGRDPDGWLAIAGSGRLERFGGVLNSPFSAHPKHDWKADEVHSIGNDITIGELRHVVIGRDGECRSTAIAKAWPPPFYVHDFILTERFLVFIDSSLRYDPSGLGRAGTAARFDAERPLRFGVIARDHRDGDPVRWFATPRSGHIWHLANGWEEEDGAIILQAPVFRDYPDSVPIHTPAEPHTEFARWRLDLTANTVDGQASEEVLLDHFFERPTFDDRRAGRRTRYAYLLDEERGGGIMGKGTLKYDLIDRREAGYVDYGDLYGGEPLFVPRTSDGEEDDGWLVDLLSDEHSAALIVVEAKTMIEACRIHLPRRVPFGVHGLWLPRVEVDALA